MIKLLVKYNPETTLVEGYFIKGEKYFGNIIDEKSKTIDKKPFIEIDQKDQLDNAVVVDGVYQEYVKSDSEKLEELKLIKVTECKNYLEDTDWQIIRLADPSSTEPLKEGVANNRDLARSLQDDINNCKTLKELEKIKIKF